MNTAAVHNWMTYAAGALVLSAISLAASLRPQSGVLKHEFDDVTRRITAPPGNFLTGL